MARNPFVSTTTDAENLQALISLLSQRQPAGIETVNIGGNPTLVKRNALSRLSQGMGGGVNAGLNLIAMTQQNRQRAQFLQGVQQIAQSQDDPDTKINNLVGLMSQHGTDYGLGINDIIEQYGKQANRKKLGSVYQADSGESIVPEGMEIVGYDQKGSPMIRKVKRDVAGEKFDAAQEEKNKILAKKSKFVIDSTKDTLDTIREIKKRSDQFGVFGGVPSWPGSDRSIWEANVNKLLAGKIIQLMTTMKETSKTGATGFGQLNREELKVLRDGSTALKRTLPQREAEKLLTEMENILMKVVSEESSQGEQTFNSEAEALSANLPKGSIVTINGRRARID